MPFCAPARSSGVRRPRNTKGIASLLAAIIIVVATLLSTASAAGTYAVLSDTSEQELLTVTSASIKATSAFGAAPTVSYTATVTEKTGNLTISNTGTIGATFTTTLTRTGSDPLAKAVAVVLWKSTAVAGCTTPVSPVTGTWASFPALSGTLAAGASQFYCIRTTLAGATGIPTNAAVTATFTTALAHATWTSSASSSVTQTFVSSADTTKPTAPTSLAARATNATSITLSWKAATDNVAVKEYLVYRGTTLVGTVASPTLTFTDKGLTPATSYTYIVRAKDAASNVSADSNRATAVTDRALKCSTGDGWWLTLDWTDPDPSTPSTSKYLLYINGSPSPVVTVDGWQARLGVGPAPFHAVAAPGTIVPVVVKKVTDGESVVMGTGLVRVVTNEYGGKMISCA